ncbi:hypothetical protein WN943_022633 [Citrus x changshan-huyou]
MPKGLKALVNLKCLNLEYTFDLIKIPRKLISNFSRLHVLRLFGHAITSVLYGGDELIVKELLGLKHLEAVIVEKSKNGLQISKDKVDGLANFKRQVEASSSSLSARTTVTNAKFKVEKFDGTCNTPNLTRAEHVKKEVTHKS